MCNSSHEESFLTQPHMKTIAAVGLYGEWDALREEVKEGES